jgi:hypothetical protein
LRGVNVCFGENEVIKVVAPHLNREQTIKEAMTWEDDPHLMVVLPAKYNKRFRCHAVRTLQKDGSAPHWFRALATIFEGWDEQCKASDWWNGDPNHLEAVA